MHQIKVDQFQGPLDLLLQLIEQEKLDITKLSLAQITEQYVAIIREAKERINPEELADFLLVAAKLMVIKSKALLPYLNLGEEEEDENDLAQQLKIYKEFYDASKNIAKLIAKKRFGFSREKLLIEGEIGFQPPKKITAAHLAKVFWEFIGNIVPLVKLPQGVIRKTINLQEKIQRIREMILSQAQLNFKTVLAEAKDKTEVIVSFLAVLELVKQQSIVVTQNEIFTEIEITKFTSDT